MNIHKNINNKLEYFYKIGNIPNIIFHGSNGSGKKTIVNNFIKKLYNNDNKYINLFTMYVNCAHGKGIKFIREELKLFAKTENIFPEKCVKFKSIILLNADNLTIDAQSALRRCIELFSHCTRFFIIIENKFKLLKPIISRFCELHIPTYKNNHFDNLYLYNIESQKINHIYSPCKKDYINKMFIKINKQNIIEYSEELYNKEYHCYDIIKKKKKNEIKNISNDNVYDIIMNFHKIKKEFKNEIFLIFFLLNSILIRFNDN